MRQRPDRAGRHPQPAAYEVARAGGEQIDAGGRARGCPRDAGVLDPLRDGLDVEHDSGQVDARDAVDHRVVRLGDQREAPVGEALDSPQLPQRLRAVELLGEDPRGQVEQLLLRARFGQRGLADVVLEVEVRIVGPQRPAGAQRGDGETLAVAGDEVQPAAQRVGDLLERRWRPLEDRHGPDVHVRDGALLVQERGVYRRQAVEVLLGGHAVRLLIDVGLAAGAPRP